MGQSLTERHKIRMAGVLSCYDRVVITGTVPVFGYAEGMTRFLYASAIRIFDYPGFAMKLRDHVRDAAASLAATAGTSIEHIAKSHIRKEEVVARVLEQRGDHPGLVHFLSAMEACDSYRPWHDKASGRTFVRPGQRQVPARLFLLHGCRPRAGLPAGAALGPFRLQFYCSGHSWLARHDGSGHRLCHGGQFLRPDR